MSKKYRVLHGLDFMAPNGKPKRHEAGTVTDDIPRESVRWLLDQGHIEEVEDDPAEARARTAEVKAVHGPPEDKAERLALDKQELARPPKAASVAEREGE
jgi:hypothetical protein